MSAKKETAETEIRRTFTTQITEVSRVKTRIQEETFKLNLPCSFEELGGLKEQTHGVVVKSQDKEALQKFVQWYDGSVQDLLEPRGWFGLAIKEYL